MTDQPDKTWTMRDVVRILGVPKHRVIYFCNEGVIRPLKDATGRGKVRLYSARNLFELSLALVLMRGGVSTEQTKLTVAAVGEFEKSLRETDPAFRIPEGLAAPGAPELRAVIGDGRHLSFILISLGGQSRVSRIPLDLAAAGETAGPRTEDHASGTAIVDSWKTGEFGQPEGSRFIRTEVGITKIAQDLMAKTESGDSP